MLIERAQAAGGFQECGRPAARIHGARHPGVAVVAEDDDAIGLDGASDGAKDVPDGLGLGLGLGLGASDGAKDVPDGLGLEAVQD